MNVITLTATVSLILAIACQSCKQTSSNSDVALQIAQGSMPQVVTDGNKGVYIVYGKGDSILIVSSDNNGQSFTAPQTIATLPHVFDFAMRGPQLAKSEKGLLVTAINKEGNIYSYCRSSGGDWQTGGRVNDVDSFAKEGLMALDADGPLAFAVWLDARHGHNEIMGAQSADGGKTWSANKTIYASPDTVVCECCKPSVMVRGNRVLVMFRNHLQGNRDMYLIRSENGGSSFGQARMLGNGHWPLRACPMDGGGITLQNDQVETIWRRNDTLFCCQAGQPESALCNGRNGSPVSTGTKMLYAFTRNGEVLLRTSGGHEQSLGKGQLPQLKMLNNGYLLCVWESEKQILAQVIDVAKLG